MAWIYRHSVASSLLDCSCASVEQARLYGRYRRAEQRSAPTRMPPARAVFSFRVRPASGRCRPWSALLGEAANGNAIGVPSNARHLQECHLQGRHFRSGYARLPVDADLGRRRWEKPRTGRLSACRASSAPTKMPPARAAFSFRLRRNCNAARYCFSGITRISTRRFLARPASVLLSAIG